MISSFFLLRFGFSSPSEVVASSAFVFVLILLLPRGRPVGR
jgi:hypothetical protein